MEEKRDYVRIPVNLPGYVFNISKTEISCVVKNVSEKGLLISISRDDIDFNIAKNDRFYVQFVDEFDIGNTHFEFIVNCDTVVRRTKPNEKFIDIGCFAHSEELSDYIRQKQLAIWYNKKHQ